MRSSWFSVDTAMSNRTTTGSHIIASENDPVKTPRSLRNRREALRSVLILRWRGQRRSATNTADKPAANTADRRTGPPPCGNPKYLPAAEPGGRRAGKAPSTKQYLLPQIEMSPTGYVLGFESGIWDLAGGRVPSILPRRRSRGWEKGLLIRRATKQEEANIHATAALVAPARPVALQLRLSSYLS